jgi:hypothetical protein
MFNVLVLPTVQSMADNLKLNLTRKFNRADMKIKNFDKKVDQKLNQLSYKIDDLYERDAVLSIIDHLRIDHGLEVRV